MPASTESAYLAIGQASLAVRHARALCDRLAERLEEPQQVLAVEGITHELTDAGLALQDAAGQVRSVHVRLEQPA